MVDLSTGQMCYKPVASSLLELQRLFTHRWVGAGLGRRCFCFRGESRHGVERNLAGGKKSSGVARVFLLLLFFFCSLPKISWFVLRKRSFHDSFWENVRSFSFLFFFFSFLVRNYCSCWKVIIHTHVRAVCCHHIRFSYPPPRRLLFICFFSSLIIPIREDLSFFSRGKKTMYVFRIFL